MQKITLIGRLGRDAAIRETQEGNKIVSFTMAVNGRFRGTEKTSWYDVSTFNYERYRNMVKYLTKGSLAIVTGDLDADLEKGNDGVTRCRRYVTADSIEFGPSNSGGTSNDRTEEAPRSSRRRSEEEEPEIDDNEMEVTRPKKRVRNEEDEEPKPARRAKPKAEEYDEEEEAPRPKKRVRDEEDDDDEPEVKPRKRKAVEPEDDGEPVKKPRRRGSEDDDDNEELPF